MPVLRSVVSNTGWLLLSAVLSGCEPDPSAPQVASIRLLSFNVKFVPDGDDINDVVFEDDAARAQYIADQLNAKAAEHDADVMVFNEAFDEHAQDTLASALCGSWPYHSRFIDEPADDQHQDSGLMIFSRHPFATLGLLDSDFVAEDHETFTGCVDADADDSHPAFWSDVGFLKYENCANVLEDCYSNKGAALARFEHQGTGEVFNVVFTHLQADDDEAETRVHQMADVRKLIEAIPDWQNQRTFVMGDLNIDGLGCSAGGCLPGYSSTDEWTEHFGHDGNFFACPSGACSGPAEWFVDSHGYEMPPTDLGRTSPGVNTVFPDPTSGSRYDYVLHNVPLERRVCLQQYRVMRELVLDEHGTPVSDHYPVLADFNYRGDHCSPMDPMLVTPNPVFSFSGHLDLPKHVQWFVIQAPGTYTIGSDNDTVVQVYAHDDLSYPIRDDGGEPSERGLVYRLPEPPYYVRVSGPDANFTGGYSLTVILHECGPNDTCGLTPGDSAGVWASWSSPSVIGTSSRWFHFDTEVADDGQPPTIEIGVEGVCSSGFQAILRDDNGTVVPWTTVAPPALPTDVTATVDTLGPGRYTVEVHRTDNGSTAPCALNVHFFTTLTYVELKELTCGDETGGDGGPAEEIGYDEIWYRLDVDGSCAPLSDPQQFTFLREFDEDDANAMASPSPIKRYNRCWILDLLEEDDIDDDDVTYLNPRDKVLGLALNERELVDERVWGGPDVNYTYTQRYVLTHESDPP